MVLRIFYYIVFWLLMTLIILGSLVVVVCLYLPFVALKAVWMTVAGKAKPRLPVPPTRDPQSAGRAT